MTQSEPNSFLSAFGAIALVVAVPFLSFLITGLAEGMTFADVTAAMFTHLSIFARPSLVMLAALSLFPLALMGLIVWIHRKRKGRPFGRKCIYWAGLLTLVAVLIWSNYEFWRLFFPELKAPGFPHGLVLAIGPVFFAPVAMAVATFAAWAVERSGK